MSKQKGEGMLKKYLYGACLLACVGFMTHSIHAVAEFEVQIGTTDSEYDDAVLSIESHLASIVTGDPASFNFFYNQKMTAKSEGKDPRFNNIFINKTHQFAVLCSKNKKTGSDAFNGRCFFKVIEHGDISGKTVYIDDLSYYFSNNLEDPEGTYAQVIEKLKAFFVKNYGSAKILFEVKTNMNGEWIIPILQRVGFNETTQVEDLQGMEEKSRMFVCHVPQEG